MEIKFNRTTVRKVRKHNRLINYKEKKSLSAIQQKLFLFTITELKSSSNFGKLCSFDMKEFFGKSRLTTRDYDTVRKAASELVSTSISIREASGKWAELSLYAKFEGEEGSSVVRYRFNEDLKPYLLNLQGNFTTYLYDNVNNFKSSFSIRIYELLIRQLGWHDVYEVDLDYLKDILGVSDVKSYTRFAKFREKVLDKAILEINQFSDLDVDYNPLRKGRKVQTIQFLIKEKDLSDISDIDEKSKEDVPSEIEKARQLMVTKPSAPSNRQPQTNGGQQQSLFDSAKSDSTSDNSTAAEIEEKKKRLYQRLINFGINNFVANKVVDATGADAKSGIWKVLYDTKLKVNDGLVTNPNKYLLKVFEEMYGIKS